MDYTFVIKTSIALEALETLTAGLEAACGNSRIDISETFDLTVRDPRQLAALKALFNNGKPEKPVKKRAASKPKPNAYQFEDLETTISPQQLHRALEAGEIEPGTALRRKGQRFVVVEQDGKFALLEDAQ